MRELLPTRHQWKQWSLPSKLTAVGVLLSVVALAYSVSVDLVAVFSSHRLTENDGTRATLVGEVGNAPGAVTITIDNRREPAFLTHESGFFRIEGLETGRHLVEAQFDGYKPEFLVLDLQAGINKLSIPPLQKMSVFDFPRLRTHLILKELYIWGVSDFMSGADIYATIAVDGQLLRRTVTLNAEDFRFHYEFPDVDSTIALPERSEDQDHWDVLIHIWDEDPLSPDDLLGRFRLSVAVRDSDAQIPILESDPTERFPQGGVGLIVEFLSDRVVNL